MRLLLLIGITMMFTAQALAWENVTKIMDHGLKEGLYPGASLVVGSAQTKIFQLSVGDSDPQRIYDIASLTKVVATATLAMVLIERGELELSHKVSRYLPSFKGGLREKVLIEDLLRHRAGLSSGARPKDKESYEDYITRISSMDLEYIPHTKNVYSDLSFILLGKIVETISGKSLKDFSEEVIFGPLKMMKTSFEVTGNDRLNCAPTAALRVCEVHDPTAHRLRPQNLGNAGLFSNLEDLSIFARVILGKGEVEGVRILSSASVEKMLSHDGVRGLGWDYLSEFSTSPRGSVFPPLVSFGHTGYTGTTMWIDPASDTYYVFLSNRVYKGDEQTKAPFSKLRKELSTAIGEIIYKEKP